MVQRAAQRENEHIFDMTGRGNVLKDDLHQQGAFASTDIN